MVYFLKRIYSDLFRMTSFDYYYYQNSLVCCFYVQLSAIVSLSWS